MFSDLLSFAQKASKILDNSQNIKLDLNIRKAILKSNYNKEKVQI